MLAILRAPVVPDRFPLGHGTTCARNLPTWDNRCSPFAHLGQHVLAILQPLPMVVQYCVGLLVLTILLTWVVQGPGQTQYGTTRARKIASTGCPMKSGTSSARNFASTGCPRPFSPRPWDNLCSQFAHLGQHVLAICQPGTTCARNFAAPAHGCPVLCGVARAHDFASTGWSKTISKHDMGRHVLAKLRAHVVPQCVGQTVLAILRAQVVPDR